MRVQLSFSTIYTFLGETVNMIDSEYIFLYGDHFSHIPLYTFVSFTDVTLQKYCLFLLRSIRIQSELEMVKPVKLNEF